jgi:N-methylhydantoinase B
MHGGGEGAKNDVYILRQNGLTERLPFGAKGGVIMKKGDVLVLQTPGGGGYGNPEERDRELVLKDIVNEIITLDEAKRDYNIDPESEWELNAVKMKM